MRKFVFCPACLRKFIQTLPDVSRLEADRLKAADLDRRVKVQCPHCLEEIWLLEWDLPDLPGLP